MSVIINGHLVPTGTAALARTSGESGADCLPRDLDVETIPSHSSLPAGQKWAIRFEASDTVTIVLGMKDYGRGWFSSYFAALVAARLGIPFERVRVYYTGTLPAVLQRPAPLLTAPRLRGISPAAVVVADLIDELCDQVIAKGQKIIAGLIGANLADSGFSEPNGCLFSPNGSRCTDLIDLAKVVRNGARAALTRSGPIEKDRFTQGEPRSQYISRSLGY
jgi:hypothetical protein